MIVLKHDGGGVSTRVYRFGEVEPVYSPCCFDGRLCQRGGMECIRSGGAVHYTVFGEVYQGDDDVCERYCSSGMRYIGFKVSGGFWYGQLRIGKSWVKLFRAR